MLLDNLEPHHHYYNDLPLHSPCSPHNTFSIPSPTSPHLLHSPSYNSNSFTYFQYPEPASVKEEPWSVPVPDITSTVQPSACYLNTRNSISPMVMSPAVSNLNTPRVSLSSQHSDFSAKLRSNHSSLHCSPHNSPLGFLEPGVGGFGHNISVHQDLQPSGMETSQSGYITPPRSGYSSPLQELHYSTAPPSYQESIQNYQIHSPYLPPPYPYDQMTGSDPSLCPVNPFTPEPESLQSEREEAPDTPDSSIKEEPGEDVSEEGTTICRLDYILYTILLHSIPTL